LTYLLRLCPKGQSFAIPKTAENGQIVHEVELGVMLKKGGYRIPKQDWKDYIGGYFLLLDYTDSLELKEAIAKGGPWLMSKAQDNFLFLSDFIPAEAIDDPHNVELELKINNEVRQKDNTGNMHYKISDQIEYISKYMTLEAGDLLMTGTPEGIAPVSEGDKLEASLTYKGNVLARINDVIKK
jgi:2-keto-4-pentenoate hydratase/2-oxohepta-3-ene-1,7-dioic acid hydratase in catechol pathway